MTPPQRTVTQWLIAWSDGDETALGHLTPVVYAELRRIARQYMRQERGRAPRGITLQTTALVNEAWLRLIDAGNVQWQNRAHFFAISAQLMRRILTDYARARQRDKRGGKDRRVSLDEVATFTVGRAPDLIALDDALNLLARIDERKSRIVELRFFGGLSVQETAEVMKSTPDAVQHQWRMAKAWLLRELSAEENDET